MIYIVTHRRVKLPLLKGYLLMQVGNAPENFPGCIRDDTGYSIAKKNANYCELTALYWIWKNTDDEYKGITHYRRFFGKRPLSSSERDIMSYDALLGLLREEDIVLAGPTVYHVSAREQLLMECCTEDTFDKLRSIVDETCPEYSGTFDTFFSGNRVSQYNMLFCRRELFDAYCAWLFPILFRLEDQVDLTHVNDYQKRLFGFLSERLLNVWVLRNGLKVKYAPIVHTAYSPLDHLTYLRRDITNGIRFRLNRGGRG